MAASFYTLPTIAPSRKDNFTIVTADPSMPDDERKALLAWLLSRFHDQRLSGLALVESVTACFTVALPEISSHMAQMKSFNVQADIIKATHLNDILSGKAPAGAWASQAYKDSPGNGLAVAVDSVLGLYASVASILFAVGRQGGSGADANSVKARPQALINRFSVPLDQQSLLPGRDLGPTQPMIERIYNGFSTHTEARMFLIQAFLAYTAGSGHVPVHIEVLLTNFRLMRGAGMTHVNAILRLAHMHPWTVRVPELAHYYRHFCDELKKFGSIPAPVREYHRLLVPQSDFLFVSSEYQPLIAVAGSYVEEVETSFAGYVYRKEDYQSLIIKVHSYEPSTSKFVGTSNLAADLGIPDMELPAMRMSDPVQTATLS